MVFKYNKLKWITVFLITLLTQYNAASSNKQKRKKPFNVIVGHPHYQQIPDYITTLGKLVPIQSTNLSFLSDGHIDEIIFSNGAKVKKNDVIAKLNDSVIKAELVSAKANLDEANSKYKSYNLLKDSGVFSKQDYISVKTSLKVAQAHYASVLVKQQQLKLIAPYSGTLGKYNYSIGAEVKPGDTIVNIVQLDPLKVSYSLNQNKKSKIIIGQSVLISSDARKDQIFNGKVTYISPTIDPNTGRFDLEATFANTKHFLSPGALVHVEHVIGVGHRALVIPQTAVSTDQTLNYVFTVTDHTAHMTNITLGEPMSNGNVIVKSGLKPEDRIIMSGIEKISDAMPVNIMNDYTDHHANNNNVTLKNHNIK